MTRRRYRDATPELVLAARQLCSNLTPAERCLWDAFRRRQVGAARFRRQHPFAGFVLDFYCPEHRLVLEVDGPIHDHQRDYDQGRTEYLEAYGFRVLRIRNDEVLTNIDAVLLRIAEALAKPLLPLPPNSPFPLPEAGGRGLGG